MPAGDGHGTHVASIAVGRNGGVAKEANVVAVRVLDCQVGDVLHCRETCAAALRKLFLAPCLSVSCSVDQHAITPWPVLHVALCMCLSAQQPSSCDQGTCPSQMQVRCPEARFAHAGHRDDLGSGSRSRLGGQQR